MKLARRGTFVIAPRACAAPPGPVDALRCASTLAALPIAPGYTVAALQALQALPAAPAAVAQPAPREAAADLAGRPVAREHVLVVALAREPGHCACTACRRRSRRTSWCSRRARARSRTATRRTWKCRRCPGCRKALACIPGRRRCFQTRVCTLRGEGRIWNSGFGCDQAHSGATARYSMPTTALGVTRGISIS